MKTSFNDKRHNGCDKEHHLDNNNDAWDVVAREEDVEEAGVYVFDEKVADSVCHKDSHVCGEDDFKGLVLADDEAIGHHHTEEHDNEEIPG